MKRRLATLLVFLVLGAIVNVAVAWGCTIVCPSRSEYVDETEAESVLARWISVDRSEYELTGVQGSRSVSVGWRLTFVELMLIDFGPTLESSRNGSVSLFVQNAGWPAMSLECAFSGGSVRIVRGGLGIPTPLNRFSNDIRLLPTRPTWPGFAINTVFYAVILWLLFAAPFALRRRRRIKRGLCPRCAYDLRGQPPGSISNACPECGTAMTCRPLTP